MLCILQYIPRLLLSIFESSDFLSWHVEKYESTIDM